MRVIKIVGDEVVKPDDMRDVLLAIASRESLLGVLCSPSSVLTVMVKRGFGGEVTSLYTWECEGGDD